MADTIDCPACGAPLTYTQDQEIVQCNFCGARFDPTPDDESTPLRVHSQPEPQKDVLTGKASEVLSTTIDDMPPAEGATPPSGTSIRPAELPTMESATIMEGPAPVDVTPADFSYPAEPLIAESATVIELPASNPSETPNVQGPADEDMIPNAWSAGSLYGIPSGSTPASAGASPAETEGEPAQPWDQTILSSSAGADASTAGLGFEDWNQDRTPAEGAPIGAGSSAPTVFSSSQGASEETPLPFGAQTIFSASQEPVSGPTPEPPPFGTGAEAGGARTYDSGGPDVIPPPPPGYTPPSGTGGLPPQRSNRGWLIALAVIAVLCILCVCIGVVISFVLPSMGNNFSGYAPMLQQILTL